MKPLYGTTNRLVRPVLILLPLTTGIDLTRRKTFPPFCGYEPVVTTPSCVLTHSFIDTQIQSFFVQNTTCVRTFVV